MPDATHPSDPLDGLTPEDVAEMSTRETDELRRDLAAFYGVRVDDVEIFADGDIWVLPKFGDPDLADVLGQATS